MKTYENETGYRIRATEKAYKMFYENQGFKEVKEGTDSPGDKPLDKWSVTEIKEALTEAGVVFDAKATKKELLELLKKLEE